MERSPAVTAALITAISSLVVSIVAAWFTYVTRVRSERKLALLNDQLSAERSRQDAQLDYEYEARKRLYTDLQPLLFQLAEVCDNAYLRIIDLAKATREGNLGPDCKSWLVPTSEYYLPSTIYRLIAPLVLFRLSQRRLTFVDLSVDSQVRAQYIMAKGLYSTFYAGPLLARYEPGLVYDPLNEDDPNPAHRLQHIYAGRLDQITEALLIREDGVTRSMTYGEFEEAYRDKDSEICKCVSVLTELLVGFRPDIRPVLWRILLAQAHVHAAIVRAFGTNRQHLTHPANILSPDVYSQFEWRRLEERNGSDELADTFGAVQQYLKEHIVMANQ